MSSRHITGMWIVRVALLLSWLALFATASYAKLDDSVHGRRLALVIGNSQYQAFPKLKNAAGDAQLVAEALQKVGFTVKLVTNATLDQMNEAIDEMAQGADPSDHVVFYYSGHGFQLDGTNYIVPTDAVLTSKSQIDSRAIRLNAAISKLQSGGRQTMVFVDACRDNPLPPSIRGNQTVNGLAKLGDGVAQNLFVAFATSPGKVSLDGSGDHGPFASALSRYLPQPNVPIYLMMTSVRNQVLADTDNDQFPTVEESLLEPFYFNGEPKVGLQFGGTPASDAPKPTGLTIGGGVAPTTPPVPTVEVATAEPAGAGAASARTGELPAATTMTPLPPTDLSNQVNSAPPVSVSTQPAGNDAGTAVQPVTGESGAAPVPTADAVPAQAPDAGGSNAGPEDIAAVAPATTSEPAIVGIDVSQGDDQTDTSAPPADTPVAGAGEDKPADDDTKVASVPPDAITPEEPGVSSVYPRLIQDQLKRLGCYTSKVDGVWDDGSKKALQRYFDVKKVASLGTDPTEDTYNLLTKERDNLCRPVAKPVPGKPAPARPRQPKAVAGPVNEPAPRATPRPAAPAPAAPASSGGIKPSFGTGSFR